MWCPHFPSGKDLVSGAQGRRTVAVSPSRDCFSCRYLLYPGPCPSLGNLYPKTDLAGVQRPSYFSSVWDCAGSLHAMLPVRSPGWVGPAEQLSFSLCPLLPLPLPSTLINLQSAPWRASSMLYFEPVCFPENPPCNTWLSKSCQPSGRETSKQWKCRKAGPRGMQPAEAPKQASVHRQAGSGRPGLRALRQEPKRLSPPESCSADPWFGGGTPTSRDFLRPNLFLEETPPKGAFSQLSSSNTHSNCGSRSLLCLQGLVASQRQLQNSGAAHGSCSASWGLGKESRPLGQAKEP